MRLHAHLPICITQQGLSTPFVSPTRVNIWKDCIEKVLPPTSIFKVAFHLYRKKLVSELSHRLQIMEFLAALILEDSERISQGKDSSLHETVKTFLYAQFCMMVCSVLEGMASYMIKYNSLKSNKPILPSDKIRRKEWENYVIQILSSLNSQCVPYVTNLIASRDSIHLDSIDIFSPLDFMSLDYDKFVEAHRTLRIFLLTLNAHSIPSSSNLAEIH